MKKKLRIGCGAGFSGDRLQPSVDLIKEGQLDYLVLECLAERTIALAQKRKLADPTKGYDALLESRIRTLLPSLVQNKTRLITNMGAANPLAAGYKIIEIAKELSYNISVAVLTGDDVLNYITLNQDKLSTLETNQLLSEYDIVSANAYLGYDGILEGLKTNADIIITGRVADPSLFLAPMIYEFNWMEDDWNLLGQGTIIGHLLECAGQVTGGYFADPVMKPVENLSRLGHPIAQIDPEGNLILSKIEGSGGTINSMTVKEQLLYEVINPSEYFTPDVIANFTTVRIRQTPDENIMVDGGTGKIKPPKLKVSIGYKAGYIGEGEISYAGANAYGRAELAAQIVKDRLSDKIRKIQIDYIGYDSLHKNNNLVRPIPYEVRLRIAGMTDELEIAELIGNEIEALYTNGPAAGGGVRKYTQQVIGIVSTLIDRNMVSPKITLLSI